MISDITAASISAAYNLTHRTVSSEENFPDCSFCRGNIAPQSHILRAEECGHVFHAGELLTWLEEKQTCPNCRGNIEADYDQWRQSDHVNKLVDAILIHIATCDTGLEEINFSQFSDNFRGLPHNFIERLVDELAPRRRTIRQERDEIIAALRNNSEQQERPRPGLRSRIADRARRIIQPAINRFRSS